MDWKQLVERALVKGENLKDEFAQEILKSKVFKEFVKSDLFGKAVSSAIKTKEDVTKVVRDNIKSVLKIMDIPSRNDMNKIQRKITSLENQVSKIGKKSVKVTTLKKKAPAKKASPAKKKAPAKKRVAAKKK